MLTVQKMLQENQLWAQKTSGKDPTFLGRLAYEQKPDVLWIGCSDSRVPSETIVNANPGEMFVHRNIANQVLTTDFNSLSVVQYAVDILKVKHVIVCGHYNCGGIRSALNKQNPEHLLVNKWLKHIRDIHRLHLPEIKSLPTLRERAHRLVELNVIEQIHNLSHTSIIQGAWKSDQRPTLHGWDYGLGSGNLKELIELGPESELNPIYEFGD